MTSNLSSKQAPLPTQADHGQDWRDILAASIVSAEQLQRYFHFDRTGLQTVTSRYPMRINPYYLSLIRAENDPIWRQAVPHVKEIQDDPFSDDPLAEEAQAAVPNLVHRYPDRVLFLVSDRCAMFCRYCMRRRRVGGRRRISAETIARGLDYIRRHNAIRDVILSGGDPLLLEDDAIEPILRQLYAIEHVEIIRIHTRVPCTLPQRVTRPLAEMIRRYHPVYISTHFNHPREITAVSAEACRILADAGIPLGCQSVLLKGVNDHADVLTDLFRKLLQIRVRPYYLHQADLVKGTGHFRTSIQAGLTILKTLRARLPSLALPAFMVDLPGGAGKVPLQPDYPG